MKYVIIRQYIGCDLWATVQLWQGYNIAVMSTTVLKYICHEPAITSLFVNFYVPITIFGGLRYLITHVTYDNRLPPLSREEQLTLNILPLCEWPCAVQ